MDTVAANLTDTNKRNSPPLPVVLRHPKKFCDVRSESPEWRSSREAELIRQSSYNMDNRKVKMASNRRHGKLTRSSKEVSFSFIAENVLEGSFGASCSFLQKLRTGDQAVENPIEVCRVNSVIDLRFCRFYFDRRQVWCKKIILFTVQNVTVLPKNPSLIPIISSLEVSREVHPWKSRRNRNLTFRTSKSWSVIEAGVLSSDTSVKQRRESWSSLPAELPKLQKLLHFPEEVALGLTEAEHKIFMTVPSAQYLYHVTQPLDNTASDHSTEAILSLLQRSRMVSSWVIQMIVIQKSHESRKAVLSCLLRICETCWRIGNFNTTAQILIGLRDEQLKPFWLTVADQDWAMLDFLSYALLEPVDTVEYQFAFREALTLPGGRVIPFIGGILQRLRENLYGSHSMLAIDRGKVKYLADYEGQDRFMARIGINGLINRERFYHVRAALFAVDVSQRSARHRPKFKRFEEVQRQSTEAFDNLEVDLDWYRPLPSVGSSHGVSFIPLNLARVSQHDVRTLQNGSTAVLLESSGRSSRLFIKLESDVRILSWSKPLWSGLGNGNADVSSPDHIFCGMPLNGLSAGLIGRYQAKMLNKLDESEDGFISLTTVRKVHAGCCLSGDYSVLSKKYGMGKISGNRNALTLSLGRGLSESYNIVFFMPNNLMQLWYRCLKGLIDALHTINKRQPDRQIPWLKKQYLKLYFEGSRCIGPTPAEAIKVFGGRKWDMGGMPTTPSPGDNATHLRDSGLYIPKQGKAAGKSTLSPPVKSPEDRVDKSENLEADRRSHRIEPNFLKLSRSVLSALVFYHHISSTHQGDKHSSSYPNHRMSADVSAQRTSAAEPSNKMITHARTLSFVDFIDLFKAFSLHCRKDLGELFEVVAVAEPALDKCLSQDLRNRSYSTGPVGLITRNNRTDIHTDHHRSKFLKALAVSSVVQNCTGAGTSSRDKCLGVYELCTFLQRIQKELAVVQDAMKIIWRHEPDPVLRVQCKLSFEGFARYMMDKDNLVFSAETADQHAEDMDHPLSHYFIDSSHNTYLTGHQLRGESSVDAYRQILLMGCRCVELDCWDGEDGSPIIYHGYTLTTKISFKAVVEAINECAFTTSPYPVILSIENRCSVPQQQKMAQIFVDVFGDKMVTEYLFASDFTSEAALPTPNQLKYKILIKNKKLQSAKVKSNSGKYDGSFIACEDEDFEDDEEDDNVSMSYNHSAGVSQMNSGDSSTWPRTQSPKSKVSVSSPGSRVSADDKIIHELAANKETSDTESLKSSMSYKKPTDWFSSLFRRKVQNAEISQASSSSKLVGGLLDRTLKGKAKAAKNLSKFSTSRESICSVNSYKDIEQLHKTYNHTDGSGKRISISSTSGSDSINMDSLHAIAEKKPKKYDIARELSALVIYTESVKFRGLVLSSGGIGSYRNKKSNVNKVHQQHSPGVGSDVVDSSEITVRLDSSDLPNCFQNSSLNENKAKNLCRKHPVEVINHCERHLLRTYPAGKRIDSTNYNPLTMWSCGIQLVALNYQTEDIPMLLNAALFETTGRSGYVLKPQVMWDISSPQFNKFYPFEKDCEETQLSVLTIRLLSGQYVCQDVHSASPQVDIQIWGIPIDCVKRKSKFIARNAVNPIWSETHMFHISCPNLAFVHFTITDVSTSRVYAQRVIKLTHLRPGYRHVPLRTADNKPLELARLFICSDLTTPVDDVTNWSTLKRSDVTRKVPHEAFCDLEKWQHDISAIVKNNSGPTDWKRTTDRLDGINSPTSPTFVDNTSEHNRSSNRARNSRRSFHSQVSNSSIDSPCINLYNRRHKQGASIRRSTRNKSRNDLQGLAGTIANENLSPIGSPTGNMNDARHRLSIDSTSPPYLVVVSNFSSPLNSTLLGSDYESGNYRTPSSEDTESSSAETPNTVFHNPTRRLTDGSVIRSANRSNIQNRDYSENFPTGSPEGQSKRRSHAELKATNSTYEFHRKAAFRKHQKHVSDTSMFTSKTPLADLYTSGRGSKQEQDILKEESFEHDGSQSCETPEFSNTKRKLEKDNQISAVMPSIESLVDSSDTVAAGISVSVSNVDENVQLSPSVNIKRPSIQTCDADNSVESPAAAEFKTCKLDDLTFQFGQESCGEENFRFTGLSPVKNRLSVNSEEPERLVTSADEGGLKRNLSARRSQRRSTRQSVSNQLLSVSAAESEKRVRRPRNKRPITIESGISNSDLVFIHEQMRKALEPSCAETDEELPIKKLTRVDSVRSTTTIESDLGTTDGLSSSHGSSSGALKRLAGVANAFDMHNYETKRLPDSTGENLQLSVTSRKTNTGSIASLHDASINTMTEIFGVLTGDQNVSTSRLLYNANTPIASSIHSSLFSAEIIYGGKTSDSLMRRCMSDCDINQRISHNSNSRMNHSHNAHYSSATNLNISNARKTLASKSLSIELIDLDEKDVPDNSSKLSNVNETGKPSSTMSSDDSVCEEYITRL